MTSRGAVARTAAAMLLFAVLWYCRVPAEPDVRLCGFHWLTGLPCPLCGMTRALFALAKGDWAQALRFNALSPLGLVMLLGLFWKGPVRGPLWSGGAAAFALYGICRIFVPTV